MSPERAWLLQAFVANWPSSPGPWTLLLSGGGDSTALFYLLLEREQPFSCLHFVHDSPGRFASESREFCQRLCQEHRVPLVLVPLEVGPLCLQGALSWEAAASRLRYDALEGRPGDFLTAHTQDDQAETVVLRLLEGAGLAGLAGIRSCRQGRIWRPLLPFRRQQLRAYLEELGVAWLDDPSNQDGNPRARLRHGLLPQLEAWQPRLVPRLARTATRLAADEQALRQLAQGWLEGHQQQGDHWPWEGLLGMPSGLRQRVWRTLWSRCAGPAERPLGSLFERAERWLASARDDRWLAWSGGCRLRRLGGSLWLQPELPPPPPPEPWWSGRRAFDEGGWEVWTAAPTGEDVVGVPLPEGVSASAQYVLRTRQPGDVFRGRCLKKLLAGTGQPPWVRDRWPLLASPERIVAVPGFGLEGPPGAEWLTFVPGRFRWSEQKMRK